MDISQGVFVTIAGMGLVFAALIVILFVIIALDRLFRPKEAETGPAPAAEKPEAKVAEVGGTKAGIVGARPLEAAGPAKAESADRDERGIGAGSFKIIVDGKPHLVEIRDSAEAGISVVVDGKAFHVEVEGEAPPREEEKKGAIPSPPGPTVAPEKTTTEALGAVVVAPMPGKILAIRVKAGDRVNRRDELCVLEAMKMEQSIRASQEGVVKEVKVSVGQDVAYGDVLVQFE